MSDLIRCDKCGVELPKKIVERRKLLFFLKIEYSERVYSILLGRDVRSDHTKYFHLCKGCHDELLNWLTIVNDTKERVE